jgi:hypothetical protein
VEVSRFCGNGCTWEHSCLANDTTAPWPPTIDMRYVTHYGTGMIRSIRHKGR